MIENPRDSLDLERFGQTIALTVILVCIIDVKSNKSFSSDKFLNNKIFSIYHGKSKKSVRLKDFP